MPKCKFNDTPAGFPALQKAREAARQQVPPMTEAQRLKLSKLSYQGHRLVTLLIERPGSRTDAISSGVAIGNVSDVAMKARAQLKTMGLDIHCDLMNTTNRYGHPVHIGIWFLDVTDHALWFGGVAANDS
jgi:hypothetical protein